MFGIETLDGTAYAAAMIGVVLIEAILLYVGYGALQAVLGPRILAALRGE